MNTKNSKSLWSVIVLFALFTIGCMAEQPKLPTTLIAPPAVQNIRLFAEIKMTRTVVLSGEEGEWTLPDFIIAPLQAKYEEMIKAIDALGPIYQQLNFNATSEFCSPITRNESTKILKGSYAAVISQLLIHGYFLNTENQNFKDYNQLANWKNDQATCRGPHCAGMSAELNRRSANNLASLQSGKEAIDESSRELVRKIAILSRDMNLIKPYVSCSNQ